MKSLALLAGHNEWANRCLFAACAELSPAQLNDNSHGYGSAMELLNHLVQVEHAFFELAHDRRPQWTDRADLADLREECTRIDRAYIAYVGTLQPEEAEEQRFLVPWFGFEISLLEGVLQPLTHSHKHRADVSMLLPLLGGTGIEMDLIQWLAEGRQV